MVYRADRAMIGTAREGNGMEREETACDLEALGMERDEGAFARAAGRLPWRALASGKRTHQNRRVLARRWLTALAAALLVTLPPAPARADPLQTIDAYSIWFTVDTSHMPSAEAFYRCLVASSTFAKWAASWGFALDLHGPYVVDRTPPSTVASSVLEDGPDLEQVIAFLIDNQYVPAPEGNLDTIYLIHAPGTVRAEDVAGELMCAAGPCAEHTLGSYGPFQYEMALVPLQCSSSCGGVLGTATHYGEHELAEAATDEVGAAFEVGDPCDGLPNPDLLCGGVPYPVQPLAGPQGDCEPIVASDPVATGCAVLGDPCGAEKDCCDCCGAGATCLDFQCTTCVPIDEACSEDAQCCGGGACVDGACAAPRAPPSGGIRGCALLALGGGGSNVPVAFVALVVATSLTRRTLRQRNRRRSLVDGVDGRK